MAQHLGRAHVGWGLRDVALPIASQGVDKIAAGANVAKRSCSGKALATYRRGTSTGSRDHESKAR